MYIWKVMRVIIYSFTLLFALLQPNYALETGVGNPFSAQYHKQHTSFFTEHGKNQEFFYEDIAVEITDDDDNQDSKRRVLHQENNPFLSRFTDLTFIKEAIFPASFSSKKSLRFNSPLYLYFQVFRI